MWGRAHGVATLTAIAALALTATAGATGFRATFSGGPQGFEDGILAGPADWSPVGGNPGGHISDSFASSPIASVATPDAWQGDRSSAFGGVLEFDLRLDPPETGTVSTRIVCNGCPGGSDDDVYYRFPTAATADWRHFAVALRPAGWTHGGVSPPPATQFGFIQALEDLLAVSVSVSDIDAGDVMYVDNVTFAANVKRKLTLKHSGDGFAGKLSPKGKCAKGQKVVVYRKKGGPDAKVGDDRTSASGKYSVREPNANGSYYAKAAASFETGAGNCLAAKSKAERA